jgi:hypothetical protein
MDDRHLHMTAYLFLLYFFLSSVFICIFYFLNFLVLTLNPSFLVTKSLADLTIYRGVINIHSLID